MPPIGSFWSTHMMESVFTPLRFLEPVDLSNQIYEREVRLRQEARKRLNTPAPMDKTDVQPETTKKDE